MTTIVEVLPACVSPLVLVPLRLRLYTPTGAADVVPTVREEPAAENTGCGLKTGFEFGGVPETAKVIGVDAFPIGLPMPIV